MNATEIECPICDRKVQSDMSKCPNCGAALSLSSFEDLEDVARTLSTDEPQEPPKARVEQKEPAPRQEPKAEVARPIEPAPKKDEPQPQPEPKKEEKSAVEPAKEEAKHGLGRLFGKKKK